MDHKYHALTGTRGRRAGLGAAALLVAATVTAGLLGWPPFDSASANRPLRFTTAAGGSGRFGTADRLYRYKVRVEDGLPDSPAQFAAAVDAVLGNTRRGWAAGGDVSFQRMPADPVDFTVYLATPATTDRICGQYKLDTGGTVNCGVGHQVVINDKRWTELSPYYPGRPDDYHALALNHEVGHVLGHGHADCPGAGQPAPVMMQQILGLHGCVPNVWPYSDDGTLLTGPPAP
ncbi:DUF3152 domain-containing protein [Kitasatospora viridis]|uniref:Uncharacterized protein DUF3152 n=1 Tax=Kitasatospora viridis TaxID=281105 RepID=A0A561SEZ4_9ACTN|nr:DUF3152 domain-containing protein [Kitasatospora viridis]TWF73443.1 uncharacterized protein DUF3152 [Kitasatospora viridis]